jgi:Kelch motif
MSYPRMHLNAVLLADGTVFVTGGGRKREYGRPVKAAELFDPLTETWTTVAAQRAPRAYHSTAVLLPDGRVLSAGHDNGRRSTMAEVYSPPYLFRGPARPSPRRSTV